MKTTLTILALSFCFAAFAQEDISVTIVDKEDKKNNKEEKKDKKPNNIINYSDLLNLKLFSSVKTNLVTHVDVVIPADFEYKPNQSTNLGFGVIYKWFGMDVDFYLPFMNDDDDIYGKTKSLDLQSNVYLKKFLIDINFQSYNGYYASNPETYDPDFEANGSQYTIHPNMNTINIGVSSLYIFNHKHFSYRAAFAFNERQVRSAGSFLAGAYVNLYTMNSDSSLVPHQYRSIAEPDSDFREVNYTSIGLSAGYAYTFIIFKKFFFSITIAFGLGVQTADRTESQDFPDYHKSITGAFGRGRTSIGYNGDKWYAGFSTINSTASNASEDKSRLERSVSNFKFFVGRRLIPPKFLSKSKE